MIIYHGSQKIIEKPISFEKMKEIAKKYDVKVGTSKADSVAAMLDLLCDEYAKEFAFEGRRFYDLQRIARHFNEMGIWGGERVLSQAHVRLLGQDHVSVLFCG